MDCSSELVHSLLPILLVSTLGASVAMLGIIEGIAEATALVTKVFSGAISDFFQKRKPLILFGYGLAALTKPLFPLAGSAGAVFTARFLDRIGKGMRGAPRDALIADVSPREIRGASFGLRQSMDTVGAFLGPAAAVGLMLLFSNQIRTVLWFAVIPALATVALILFGVKEPEHKEARRAFRSPIHPEALRKFSSAYWRIVVIGAIFTLARFSEAFLVLRATQAGLTLAWAPVVMIVMNVVYALSAYPAGILSDRIGRRGLLLCGLLLLAAADFVLAHAGNPPVLLWGVSLWGLHMGLTQGILAALVADTTSPALKGTAFGIFNLVAGLFTLLASVLAGALWSRFGAPVTFYASAGISLTAFATLVVWRGSGSSGAEHSVRT
jgi:MFS family permease